MNSDKEFQLEIFLPEMKFGRLSIGKFKLLHFLKNDNGYARK